MVGYGKGICLPGPRQSSPARGRLAAEGLVFGAATLQRFLKRHGLQRKPAPKAGGRCAAGDDFRLIENSILN